MQRAERLLSEVLDGPHRLGYSQNYRFELKQQVMDFLEVRSFHSQKNLRTMEWNGMQRESKFLFRISL